jgi:hypothetical protein
LIGELRKEVEQKVAEKASPKTRVQKVPYVAEHMRGLPGRAFFT